jgi:hypothetical protein
MKVLIGIATGGEIKSQTVESLLQLVAFWSPDTQLMTSIQIGGYKTFNMNKLVELAKTNECTHLLNIDSDMIFPPNALQRLLSHDKDIVGYNYSYRGSQQNQSNPPSVVKFKENGNYIDRYVPDGLFECDALGLGFLLFKTSVFDKLEEPYFELNEIRPAMEDVIICEKLREHYKIYCDGDLKLGHIGTYVY